MRECRLYTKQEDEFIRSNYLTTNHKIIAEKLCRTVKSIRNRAAKIGCDVCFRKREWTKDDDGYILSSKGKALTEVAAYLNRHPTEILKRSKKLGFKSWRRPDGGPPIIRGYEVVRFSETAKPIFKHRIVAEEIIGRELTNEERVHHIDLDKRNNKPENLFICASPCIHKYAHNSLLKLGIPYEKKHC